MLAAPPAASARKIHVPELDGVRGIAIVAVLIVHYGFFLAPEALPHLVLKLFAPFWIGVNIFFVLSGFLITGILLDTKDTLNYFASFYMRRVLRIFPLYFAMLVLVFDIAPVLRLQSPTPVADQIWLWAYLFNWEAARGRGLRGLSHFWSLAVEEQFYLIWPVVVYWVNRSRLPLVCVGGIVASFLFRAVVIGMGYPNRVAYFLTPGRVEDLAIGALAAWIIRDALWARRAARYTPWIAVGCLLGFLLAWVLGRGFEATSSPAVLFGSTSVSVLTALVILATLEPSAEIGGVGKLLAHALRNRTLRSFGKYSYGIYVFHLPLIVTAHEPLRRLISRVPPLERVPLAAAAMLATTLVLFITALASYNIFEKHFLALKQLFVARELRRNIAVRSGYA